MARKRFGGDGEGFDLFHAKNPMTGREGRAHNETKAIVERMLRGDSLFVSAEVDGRFRSFAFDTSDLEPVIECEYPSGARFIGMDAYWAKHQCYPEMVLDVGLVRDGKIVAGVEVIRSHGLDAKKRNKIRKAGFLCLCVKGAHWDWYVDDRRLDVCEILGSRESLNLLKTLQVGASTC